MKWHISCFLDIISSINTQKKNTFPIRNSMFALIYDSSGFIQNDSNFFLHLNFSIEMEYHPAVISVLGKYHWISFIVYIFFAFISGFKRIETIKFLNCYQSALMTYQLMHENEFEENCRNLKKVEIKIKKNCSYWIP